MTNYLIYNFSGELDDLSHIFPNDRFAQISAIMKESGQHVEIWDRGNIDELISLEKEYLEELGNLSFDETTANHQQKVTAEAHAILSKNFDVVLVNLWHGSGFKFSSDLVTALKAQNPSLHIFGIGQKVDWFKESILHVVPALDGVILGLGYRTIELMARGQDIANLPNMILNHNGKITSNAREIVDPNLYKRPIYSSDIYHGIDGKFPLYEISLSNQACPQGCVFCVRPETYGRVGIRREVDDVVQEIAYLVEHQHAKLFRINDSTPPPDALTTLAQTIIDRGLHNEGICLSGFSRIDVNRNEQFDVLRKANIGALFFGIESLDDRHLTSIKKGTNYPAIKDTLQRAHESGIYTIGSFIFPLPGETETSMNTTLERIAEMKACLDSVLVLPAGIYPPTEWGKHPEKYGIKLFPDYVDRMVIYPIKYLIPLHLWPPMAFSYDIMGKPADEVSSQDIVRLNGRFVKTIREEIGIPGIPDYYWSIAKLFKQDVADFTKHVVMAMIQRNYREIEKIVIAAKTV
jgi:radical SAM superfamily enzyme YgiQ (UPF0313 family)